MIRVTRGKNDFTDDFSSLPASWKAHYGGLTAEEIEVKGEVKVVVMFPGLEPNLYICWRFGPAHDQWLWCDDIDPGLQCGSPPEGRVHAVFFSSHA